MSKDKIEKIMLVEDEDDIRAIAKISLEEIGMYSVEYCSSGKEALIKAKTYQPDLILLDMMMPEMDGIEVLQALRKDELTKNIPVIFLSAKVNSSNIQEFISLGAIDVISKPFDPISLPDTINNIWRRHHDG